MKIITKLWIGIAILVILSPLGLILPRYFKTGPAWGEWGADEIQKLAGYIPRGLERLSGLWKAPMHDYAIISTIAGVIATIIIALVIGRILARKSD